MQVFTYIGTSFFFFDKCEYAMMFVVARYVIFFVILMMLLWTI